MFDVLVFTDTAASESLSGSPGFQFIAHSAGATLTDEGVARDRLQHTVPSALPEADWASHPATCLYARVDERMYLSRGQSTGATRGGRPGNQITVTVMTSDPYDLLPLRPAQLFSSPSWDFARPTGQDLAGWEAPVQIADDFDVPGLHALIAEDAWAAGILPSALTMLEQTQAERRTRLFIRHPDQVLVMRWVALLSRFLDADSALAFEFRVFTDDPNRANTHVVGVHPLLAPDLTASSAAESGVNLIDVEQRELSAITPSESAERYARWFLAGDPYEALEAIEVGRRWSRHMDADAAAAAAELATMGSIRGEAGVVAFRTALAALIALADARQTDELEAYGDELADIAASCPPTDASDLLLIDRALWAVVSVEDGELAQSLALAALEWAAARPELLREWASSSHPTATLVWPDVDARGHAAQLLAASINAAGAGLLSDVFRLANSLDTGMLAQAVETPIRRLIDQWISDPALTRNLQDWVEKKAIVARLNVELDARLSDGDPSVERSLVSGAWDWLSPDPWRIETGNPLSRWLAVRQFSGADAQRRSEVLSAVQSTLPDGAWRVLLPTASGLDPDEVVGWIRSHGGVDSSLAAQIEQILREPERHSTWQRAGGAKVLHEVGKLGETVPAVLAESVSVQVKALKLFGQASKDKDLLENPSLRELGRRFAGRLNGLYGDWIAKAVLESQDLRAAVALAEGRGREKVIVQTRSALEAQLRMSSAGAMAAAVRLLDPALGPWNEAAKGALDTIWDDKRSETLRQSLLDSVDGRLGADDRGRLEHYLHEQPKGRITRGVLRGAKSVFGKKK